MRAHREDPVVRADRFDPKDTGTSIIFQRHHHTCRLTGIPFLPGTPGGPAGPGGPCGPRG